MMQIIKESWSVKEVAKEVGVSERLVRRWLEEKRLVGNKRGKAWVLFECRKPERKVQGEHEWPPYYERTLRCPYCGYEETVVFRRPRILVKAKQVIEYKGRLYHVRRCGPL